MGIAVVNILITCMEIDSYPGNEQYIYGLLSLPCFQILLTVYILLFKYEFLKKNLYNKRMQMHNAARQMFLAISQGILIYHTIRKYLSWGKNGSGTALGLSIFYTVYILIYCVFLYQFLNIRKANKLIVANWYKSVVGVHSEYGGD